MTIYNKKHKNLISEIRNVELLIEVKEKKLLKDNIKDKKLIRQIFDHELQLKELTDKLEFYESKI